MMRNKKLAVVILIAAVGLIVLSFYGWSSIRADAAVEQHLADMEVAWQRYQRVPEARENLQSFVFHRNELVRLGHLQQRDFDLPVKLGTPEGSELIKALMERSNSRPMCEWSPKPTGTHVKVFASAEEMPKWEA